MLSVLIHGTLVSDSSEKGEENRKSYTSLIRKLKVSILNRPLNNSFSMVNL